MKKVYEIEIDCPMCAQKVEKHLNKQENIKSATIDYSTKRVFLDFHKEIELNDLNKIIKDSLSYNWIEINGEKEE